MLAGYSPAIRPCKSGMEETMRRILSALAAVLVAVCLVVPALADSYPSRPISLVVAFTPGGPSDILARILGQKLSEILGKPIVVDNRPGAGGNVAAEFVARSNPDGYTLLMGNNSILATNAALYANIRFNVEKDFIPISLVGSQANILVVNPKLPVKSMSDLIALAKSKPSKLTYASSGYGAAAHLSAELFKHDAGVQIEHIPYKGAAPALQDVVSGQVDMMFATAASVTGFIKAGSVRALAVTTAKRIPAFPDLPTIDELGLKGFEATTWHGLVAPTGTPPDIIAKLNAATVQALKDPEVRNHLQQLGVEIVGSTPQEFAAYIKSETPKWTAVVQGLGAKLN
jgi:tripartite-type tricarboxylate transporter receptor subunit TctC